MKWMSCTTYLAALLLFVSPLTQAETYSYDSAGRLINVVYDDLSTLTYQYDANGNILSRTTFLPTTQAPSSGGGGLSLWWLCFLWLGRWFRDKTVFTVFFFSLYSFSTPTFAIVSLADTFDGEIARLNYAQFINWDVVNGSVDTIASGQGGYFIDCPTGGGICIDMDGTTNNAGDLVSKGTFVQGIYTLEFTISGNQQPSGYGPDTITVSMGDYTASFTMNNQDPFKTFSRVVEVPVQGSKLTFSHAGGDTGGIILDDVFVRQTSAALLPAIAETCLVDEKDVTVVAGSSSTFTAHCSQSCTGQIWLNGSSNESVATVTTHNSKATAYTTATTPVEFTVNGIAPGESLVLVEFECPASPTYAFPYGTLINPNTYPSIEVQISTVGSDTTGNRTTASVKGDPVNTYTGELFSHEREDINLGGPMPLVFKRYYASYLRRGFILGDLGSNWLHNFDTKLHWNGNSITYFNQTGRATQFRKNLVTGIWSQLSNPDVAYQLVAPVAGQDVVFYDPQDKRIYTFDYTTNNLLLGKLKKVEDGKGNAHTLTYGLNTGHLQSITDGLGRALTFSYDSSFFIPKINSVSDGARFVSFLYLDSVDQEYLTSFVDMNGGVTTYAYKDTRSSADQALMSGKIRPQLNVPFQQTFFDTTNQFNSGKVDSQSDAAGNTTHFVYSGNVTEMTDVQGNIQRHNNTADGNFIDNQDSSGHSLLMGYDVNNRRTSITDRLGDVTTYAYHAGSANLELITHADGTQTRYVYNSRSSAGLTRYDLSEIVSADGNVERFIFDSSGNLTQLTDQIGEVSLLSYNSRGQVLTVMNPIGGVVSNRYNTDGTLASIQDSAGNTSLFSYDGLKRLNLITRPDNTTTAFGFDAANNLLMQKNNNGHTVTMSYDANNNVVGIQPPLSGGFTLAYDGNDRLTEITGALGGKLSINLDSLGQIVGMTNPNGNKIMFAYDGQGNLLETTDPLGGIWSNRFDLEGGLLSGTDPLGNTTAFTLDKMGRVTQSVSPLGHTQRVEYDEMGRVKTLTDELGRMTSLLRDERGLIMSSTLLSGQTVEYRRNALGQITQVVDANGNDWAYTFDSGGRKTSSVDPLGQTRHFSFDDRNRLSAVTYPATLGTLSLMYDGQSQVVSRDYSDGTSLNYSYNASGRLLTANGINNSFDATNRQTNSNGITASYDIGGRLNSLTLATGKTVTYGYDANDRLIRVTDWMGGVTRFDYDSANNVLIINRPNGIHRSNRYDADVRLVSFTEGNLASATLSRDANGQITNASRTSVTSRSANGVVNQVQRFDKASQINNRTYDGFGRLVSDGSDSYEWDLASRLSNYTRNGQMISSRYDAAGFRVSRQSNTILRQYVWNYILEIPSVSIEKKADVVQRYYVHTPAGALLYSVDASSDARFFYHFDEMGNTLFISDDAGVSVASYAHSPYGVLLNSTGVLDNPFTWQGELGVMDEGNGLYYIRSRYYDATIGRFISRDVMKNKGIKSINPYQYAYSNPQKFIDWSGYDPETKAGYKFLKRPPSREYLENSLLEEVGGYPSLAVQFAALGVESEIGQMACLVNNSLMRYFCIDPFFENNPINLIKVNIEAVEMQHLIWSPKLVLLEPKLPTAKSPKSDSLKKKSFVNNTESQIKPRLGMPKQVNEIGLPNDIIKLLYGDFNVFIDVIFRNLLLRDSLNLLYGGPQGFIDTVLKHWVLPSSCTPPRDVDTAADDLQGIVALC